MENEEKKFIGLEYLEVDSLEKYASIYEDGYSNLGWRLIDQKKQHAAKVTLRFKRDRKIRNRAELTRLQRKFDSLVRDIIHLENSKKTLATASSIFTGIIGCAFLVGSVFFVNDDQIFLCILFSIPGFLCWLLPYFMYKKIVEIKTIQVTPKIEADYDGLYEISESGLRLL